MKPLGPMAALLVVFSASSVARDHEQIRTTLTGYQETPAAVNTGAHGEFHATISADQQSITYEESWDGLQADITQSHIHVGQLSVGGSVVIFLCQTAGSPDPTGLAPDCLQSGNPRSGSVSGTITTANVIAGSMPAQQLHAGDLASVIKAIRAGAAYANVHTTVSPGGEIRGQIRSSHDD
jgi:hypothetical protein